MPTITVMAAPGLKVPREDRPTAYIDANPVIVEDSAYYRRRMDDGDLLRVAPLSMPQTPEE